MPATMTRPRDRDRRQRQRLVNAMYAPLFAVSYALRAAGGKGTCGFHDSRRGRH